LNARGPDAEVYTPAHLADGVLASRSAVEGERKQVTVLFCDLAGSTVLAEQLGPETIHALLERFFEVALAEIHRFGGTVNQFLGDGFMALFGAPVAREDHARRSVLAALGIQRGVGALAAGTGTALAVRMGINTGLVVVGAIGDHLRMDYTAVGDTTNVAGRLEQWASPGSILVGETTARLAQGYVRLEPMGPLPVRGRAEPVTAYRVLGLGTRRARLDPAAGQALTTLVGRQDELKHLEELFARAEAGRGQVVSLVGEPGVGKSRLLREFRHRLGGRAVTWLEGHCASYGEAVPYLPVIQIIRQNCGIAEADPPSDIVAKVRASLREVGLDADAGAPCLLHLLGVREGTQALAGQSPEAIKSRTFALLREMALRGSRRHPLIILVEDLQWIDALSEEYAATLVERAAGAPLLLVFTYRPGHCPRWADGSHGTQLALPHLTPDESRGVVQAVLGGRALDEPATERILSQAEGNPLFLEELTRAADHGEVPAGAPVPALVQDLLGARIDRLPDASRRLLQMASVVGREVSLRLLSAVWEEPDLLGDALGELLRLEFLHEVPRAAEATYAFKHALVHEVTYATLLERRRRIAHGAIGRALETLYAGRTDEVAELLAYHFGRSEASAKAVDYGILAAEKAQRRLAHAEALTHFDGALDRLVLMPDSETNRLRRIDAVVKQAEVKFALDQHAEHVPALESIRDLVERAGDPRRRAEWSYWTGVLGSLTGGPPAEAIARCREALRLADDGNFADIRAYAECCLAQSQEIGGDLEGALGSGARALAVFESAGDAWWACRALGILGSAAAARGEWVEALAHSRRALEHGLAVNDARLKILALLRLGATQILMGDVGAGMAQCDTANALSPNAVDIGMLQAIQGQGLVKMGRARAGAVQLAASLASYDERRLTYPRTLCGLWLAEARLQLGEVESARALVDASLATCREVGYRHLQGIAHRLLGECVGSGTLAAGHLETALLLLERAGARNELGKALRARAEVARRDGEPAVAREGFERARALFDELGTLDEPARVRVALATLDGVTRPA
jgi:class 3 adenylate cyclase/tetratricopeptide (TPR) repeat protein